jgi:REP element-mobilizing transposase RayT
MSRRSSTSLVVHVVTATRRRAALIPPTHDEWVRETMQAIARTWHSDLLAVGGAADHLHLVVRFPPTLSISTLAGYFKGASAHHWNLEPAMPNRLEWQDGFWAETWHTDAIGGLVRYVRTQREHHRRDRTPEPWEFALGLLPIAPE